MPRDIHTIGIFDKGVVYAADNQDIDSDAASYQLNVWANTEEGKLIGRPTDTAVQSTLPAYYAESYAWLQRGDLLDLFYYNGNDQRIEMIQDVYGTPSASSLGEVAPSNNPSMVPLNKEVHIGVGNSSTTPPKWAGYATSGQFGAPAPTNPFVTDAECKVEGTIPYLYKIHVETVDAEATVFGIAKDGQYLYKIVISTGVITRTDAGIFKHTYAMCPDATAGFAWVYDRDSDMGTLYRINLSTLAVERSHTIATHALPQWWNTLDFTFVTFNEEFQTCHVSDIAVTTGNGGTIWLAYFNEFGGSAKLLWRATIIPSGEMTFTDATPALVGGTVQDGQFSVWDGSTFYYPNRGVVETFYERCLTPLDGTAVGWLVKTYNAVGSFDNSAPPFGGGIARTGPYYERTGSLHQIVNHIVFAVNDSVVAGDGVGIYEVNTASGSILYNGIVYTPTGYKMHISVGTTLNQYSAGATVPAAGGWVDATSVATKTFTYPMSVSSQLSTDVYVTRTTTKVGIDKVDTGLSAITEVFNGANVYLNSPANNATTEFTALRTYFYRLAIEYDGYQLSVLSSAVSTVDNNTGVVFGKDVPIAIADIAALNKRVTAIYLFRASGPYQATAPDNLYRAVERISVNDGRWVYSAGAASLTVYDNVEVVGVTYEAISGCAESLDSNIVHYAVSAATNGVLYVGNCYHPEIKDAEQYVFASKPGRYDMFNWIDDFLRLPFIPIALVSYAGRLWAFSHDRIARIIPDGLVLEDIYEGAGIDHPRSVRVTEQGMFFANRNNIYWHDGQSLNQIGNPILDRTDAGPGSLTDYSYRTMYAALHAGKYPDVVYSSKHQYLFVFMRETDDELYAWGYHVAKKRWDFFTFALLVDATTVPYGYSILGFKGELYYSETNTVYRLFDVPGTRLAWTWVGNRFTGGTPDQTKKFYEVKSISSGTAPTITYSVDEGAYASLTGDLIATADRLKKSIRVKIVGAASTAVNAVSIIYRNLVGYR